MSKMSRSKGQRGEREICQLLGDALGISLDRNLEQTRDGGCDIIVNKFWAVEVKRGEKLQLENWWTQACDQAENCDKYPVLFFRRNREEWRCLMPYSLTSDHRKYYVHGDLALFIDRVKDDS